MAKKATVIPGDHLKKVIADFNIPIAKVAEQTGISVSTIRQIIIGKLRITAHVAAKLGKYFGEDPLQWMELQSQFELAELTKDEKTVAAIKAIPKAKKQEPAPQAPAKKGPAKKVLATAEKKPHGKPGPKKAAAKPKTVNL
jgi:addiction module HigA family antidote